MWCAVFFFASAGASAAYLTVSEIFPMETRAMAIAFFYAVGTGLGGIIGPVYFGKLIEDGRDAIVTGYYVGAALMIAAGLVELVLGVKAAGSVARGHRHAAHRRGGGRRRAGSPPVERAGSRGRLGTGQQPALVPLDVGSRRTSAQGRRTQTQREHDRQTDHERGRPTHLGGPRRRVTRSRIASTA